jgi:predicted ATPase/DNA-binding CsgD family transcriptional regulator
VAGPRSALPARRTRLIGRQREVEDIRGRVLHGDRRLSTLTGAGGSGKTVLAVEVGRSVEHALADGVWFVDLSVLHDADAALLAMSEALGIVDQERLPMETLVAHLAPRQALLLLDNCEHLLPSLAKTVDALLDGCPDLRILATSRVPLRVEGESIFVVAPFPVPGSAGTTSHLGELAGVPSVELFVERASAVDPAFHLSESTAPAVASICRRLDGLPLAIELAAAQAALLTPAEIDERLLSTGVLSGPNRPGPARQRTMQSALDWSHDLLSPTEQAVYRRLAVFSGGWTLEAAEQVCSLGEASSGVIACLAALVEHSLVVRDGDGERSRYRMLAPIAEDATRRLTESGELGPTGMAHAGYYLEMTTREFNQFGQVSPEALDRVAVDHENCLAAIRFAEQAGVLPLRIGLIRNLMALWRIRGHLRLGARHMDAALGAVPDASYERAMLLGVLAEYQQLLGEYEEAEQRAREAEAILAALGIAFGQRMVIGVLGLIAAARGDYEQALAEYRRARPLVDADPDDGILAFWHAGVGRFELGLGDLEAAERDLEIARDHFGRAPSWSEGWVLAHLGVIARRNGDPVRAGALLGDALRLMRRYGAKVDAINCLEDVARLRIDQRDWQRAATLLAASTSLRDATAATVNASDRAALAAEIDQARSMLEAHAFEDAWSRGLGLSLDEAAEFATGTSGEVVAVPIPRGSALTPRELEIADLVALGLTNRQIAERLVISPGTVRIHVERILGKLGRTSRVQVATWVMDQRARTEVVETAAE